MPDPRALVARQFSSLAGYNYRIYFFGQMISLVGTWMQATAQDWLVLQTTHSPLALGTVATLQFLPITLLTLFGGVFADRLPKRRMLIITQTLALIQAAILAGLVVSGRVELWHIYVLAAWLGCVNALDSPVRQSFVVELVGRDQLVNAVALNSSIFNTARIIGPAAAGLAIGFVGLSMAFVINATSFVAVIGAYLMMHPSEFYAPVRKAASSANVLKQIAEGVQYSVRTPSVLYLFIMLAFIGAFGYNFSVIIPLVAEFVLHVGPERFGLLTSFLGAGSLISALGLAAKGQASGRLLVGAALLFIVCFLGIALSPVFAVTAAVLVVLGIAGVAFSTTINTTLQLIVPDELRGRVMSIFFLLFAGSTPLGGWLTGWLGEAIGVRQTLALEAVMCAVGVGLALLYRASKQQAFRAQPAAAAAARTPAGGP